MTVTRLDAVEQAYRDPARSLRERLEALLALMTREEKVAQLGSAWVFQLAEGGQLAPGPAAAVLGNGIGHITRISGASSLRPEETAQLANAIQRYLVEETRLGIPAIVHEEICSGLMARDATVFPQAIGLASTWEPELARSLAAAISSQMRAVGAHHGLAPVLDVCRDPRWGRTEETLGEDPYLVARMGVAFVLGLQGESLGEGVIATAKHFVGYGASDGGMNWAPAGIPPRELREVYLHPFEAAVRVGGVGSVMNAYNEVDGVVCTADRELLTTLLREEWAFDGYVVSDYFSIRQLESYHRLAEDGREAAAMALNAGLDLELPSTDCYGRPLLDALEAGFVSESTVDDAVRRVLAAKFELGLFDDPYVDATRAADAVGTPSHRTLARRIARKSIVLLKNDGILPLAPGQASIAVIGPNADTARNLFGDYCYPAHVESLREVLASGGSPLSSSFATLTEVDEAEARGRPILEAMRERFGSLVSFARGCDVEGPSRAGFEEAVELAARSDVAVLVMGDKAGLGADCTSGEFRDRASLDLPGVQEELIRAVVATGTPVVLVLVTGRPSGSAWAHEHCAAVVEAWFPGEEGGAAVAEVLAGEVNPGGKLPLSFPRSVGQIPVFYAHKLSGGRSQPVGDYIDLSASPLYPFGHGLSYTTFELSAARIREQVVGASGELVVDVVAANTGDRAGDEVVQLYVRDPRASVTRPVLELKSFARLALAPSESRTVTFRVPVAQLGFYDRELAYVVEPGVIEVFVGRSSDDLARAGRVTIAEGPSAERPPKAFDGSVSIA
jgi:beta-glucosidase